jgi:hypothetical protein
MATAVWTGAIGDVYSDFNNWMPGVVPDGADDGRSRHRDVVVISGPANRFFRLFLPASLP